MLYSLTPDHWLVALFATLLIAAAVTDVLRFRIPNSITLAIAICYPVYVAVSPGAIDWQQALIASAVVLVGGFALFALGSLGGGDAKLLAAASLWAGTAHLPIFLIVTALIGGGLAMVMLSPARYVLAHVYDRLGASVGASGDNPVDASMLPYGVAIAGGGLMVAYRLVAG